MARSRFHSLLNEAQVLFASFFYGDHFPSLGWLDKLSGQCSRLDNIFKKFDDFYEQIIKDHLNNNNNNSNNNNNNNNKPKSEEADIVDILLRLKEDGSFPIKITLDHIKATLMVIISLFNCQLVYLDIIKCLSFRLLYRQDFEIVFYLGGI